LEDHAPVGTLNAQAYAQAQFPEEDPHWDSNDHLDYQPLEWYQKALLQGMKKGGRMAINIRKTSEVLQGLDESPSQFYEHLCEAFHFYTPFDLEAAENLWMISTISLARPKGT
jgi:hypothetical protein